MLRIGLKRAFPYGVDLMRLYYLLASQQIGIFNITQLGYASYRIAPSIYSIWLKCVQI